MASLNLKKNVMKPDDVYQLLIDLHQGCDQEESNIRNAKLILCLANHIGDEAIINEAIEIAKGHSVSR